MIENALKIMLFMWSVSFSLLGGQYMADVYDVEMINSWTDFDVPPDGIADNVSFKLHLLTLIDEDTINETAENIVTGNFTTNSTYYDKVETGTTAMFFVSWEVINLIAGTYIFNLLYLMGVPIIFVVALVIMYIVLLGRAVMGYLRQG